VGKVTTDIKIVNKYTKDGNLRELELKDVIVDSGASMMCLSKKMIEELDLEFIRRVKVNTAEGIVELGVYGPVLYEIKNRMATGEVLELRHPKIEALIGQIPLEQLDFLIDPSSNKLIYNPAHNGELVLDMLIVSEDLITL